MGNVIKLEVLYGQVEGLAEIGELAITLTAAAATGWR